MIQFYAPDIADQPLLGEEESAHCCRVLRKKEGDVVRVTDGKGKVYECEITDCHPKHTMLAIVNVYDNPKVWNGMIRIALAPTKNIDRIEWFIEKAVEIGVDEIILLQCDRSERKNVRIDRLRKIVISAMNQSLKAHIPVLTELTKFRSFISRSDSGLKCMGYCDENVPRLDFAKEYASDDSDVTILIGPEGDFSPEEVRLAMTAGYRPVTFGDNRLRTETAALYALTTVHVVQDLNEVNRLQ